MLYVYELSTRSVFNEGVSYRIPTRLRKKNKMNTLLPVTKSNSDYMTAPSYQSVSVYMALVSVYMMYQYMV